MYTATLTTSPFSVLADPARHAAAVEDFLAAPSARTVPVWTDGRPDLEASAERATALYDAVRRPTARTYGVLLDPGALPAGLVALIEPLAATWLAEGEVDAALVDRVGANAAPGEVRSLLIAGRYDSFTVDLLWPVLRAAAGRPDVRLTFLLGRDAPSLAWFTAKQYVRPAPDVRELGLFTATDRGLSRDGVHLRDERAIGRTDVRAEILGTSWRRILLQGHGKDDSLNLAEFTVCGRNDAVRPDGSLGPICAYEPTCYKPVDKLIQLREIRAAEVVLSSCNNAPFADAAVYDPKYQLMLNAIDGTAKDVVAAISVHDSDRAENTAWLDAALGQAASVTALNASNGAVQPFPAYVHFGLGEDGDVPAEPASLDPDALLLATSARLTAYLGGGLLGPSNRLRARLGKIAGKVEDQVTRRSHATQDRTATMRGLLDDLQSLDQTIITQFVQDPDSELSNFAAHFGDRSRLDRSSLTHVRCQCGRPAERYTRRALVPTALDVEGVICMRCGDVSFRMLGAPGLLLHADADDVPPGGTLQVRAQVQGARPGAVRLSLAVASYGREHCRVTPDVRKVRAGGDGGGGTEFTLTVDEQASGQGYYVTAYAVQDLAVTMARRHFGVVPLPGPGIRPLTGR